MSERRRKSEALEALLPTLARALDVPTVFSQISEVTREVLAHDYLSVGLVTADGAIRFHASSLGRGVGRPAAGLSKDARDRLLAHQWPGNIRELRNAIERAVILCERGLVTGAHLPISIAGVSRRPAPVPQRADIGARGGEAASQAADGVADKEAPAEAGGPVAPAAIPAEGVSLDAIERELIQKAMAQARNNKSEAARLLGLARGQLYSRLKRHGLDK